MATSLPQVMVGPDHGGLGHRATCSCTWSVQTVLRIDADLAAVEHRASHATPLREPDDDRPWRIDEVVA